MWKERREKNYYIWISSKVSILLILVSLMKRDNWSKSICVKSSSWLLNELYLGNSNAGQCAIMWSDDSSSYSHKRHFLTAIRFCKNLCFLNKLCPVQHITNIARSFLDLLSNSSDLFLLGQLKNNLVCLSCLANINSFVHFL